MLEDDQDLKGLGGWLILVGIGLIVGPLRLGYEFIPMYYEIFSSGAYDILSTPGTEVYSPMWGPLIIFETIYNAFILVAFGVLLYLFFRKHYLFPKVYIFVIALGVVFIPLDAWLVTFVMPDEPMFDPDTLKEFARSAVAVVVWVPYMLVSKRVKATFVENKPQKNRADESDPIAKRAV